MSSQKSYHSPHRRVQGLRIDRSLAARRSRPGSHSIEASASCPCTYVGAKTPNRLLSVARSRTCAIARYRTRSRPRTWQTLECARQNPIFTPHSSALFRARRGRDSRCVRRAHDFITHCLSSGIATPPMMSHAASDSKELVRVELQIVLVQGWYACASALRLSRLCSIGRLRLERIQRPIMLWISSSELFANVYVGVAPERREIPGNLNRTGRGRK